MEHYRRKPLQLIDSVLPEAVGTLPTLANPPQVPQSSSSLPTPLVEPLLESVPDLERLEGTGLMPSPDVLVQQAASILEGDMAESVQNPWTPVSGELGSTATATQTGYSVPGLVNEMHDFVDALVNVMAHKPHPIGHWEQGTTTVAPASIHEETSVPQLHSPQPVHPGEAAHLSFKVHNDGDQSVQVRFVCTDLHSPTGSLIPHQAISISPPVLNFDSDIETAISITVQLPQSLPGGEYSGLLMATELSYLKAVVTLKVV